MHLGMRMGYSHGVWRTAMFHVEQHTTWMTRSAERRDRRRTFDYEHTAFGECHRSRPLMNVRSARKRADLQRSGNPLKTQATQRAARVASTRVIECDRQTSDGPLCGLVRFQYFPAHDRRAIHTCSTY